METASVATCQGHVVSMANHVMACCYFGSLTYVCHPFAQLISLWYFYFVSAQSVEGSTFLLFSFFFSFFACVFSQHTHCFRFYYCRPWKRWRSMAIFQILKAVNYWILSFTVFKHSTDNHFCYILKIHISLPFTANYAIRAKYVRTVSYPKVYVFPLIQFLFYFSLNKYFKGFWLQNMVRALFHNTSHWQVFY